MATQFGIDCALMAGASYISTRSDKNKFPVPAGWSIVPSSHFNDISTGFEAVAFQRGTGANTEIVISYAGTDSDDLTGDVAADLALGAGLASEQLLQAAEYYLQIKAINPDAKITLTGHSLGGGLASLVAVLPPLLAAAELLLLLLMTIGCCAAAGAFTMMICGCIAIGCGGA